jgi:maltose alpha-D-glucosyltransferase/alpha-amylase
VLVWSTTTSCIIDFEGEPRSARSTNGGAKQSALRDVAGMLRSFDYARQTALRQAALPDIDRDKREAAARLWATTVRATFLAAYRDAAIAGGLYADTAAFDAAAPLLELFEIEKALYELRYELNNRPDWVGVPLTGIAALSGT